MEKNVETANVSKVKISYVGGQHGLERWICTREEDGTEFRMIVGKTTDGININRFEGEEGFEEFWILAGGDSYDQRFLITRRQK